MAKEEMLSLETPPVSAKTKPEFLATIGRTLTSILQTEIGKTFTANDFLAEAERLQKEYDQRYLSHILRRRTPVFNTMAEDLSSAGLTLYLGKRRKYNNILGTVHRNTSAVVRALPTTEAVGLFDIIRDDKDKVVAVDYDWLDGLDIPSVQFLKPTMSYQRREINARHEAEMERVRGYIEGDL